MIAHFSSQAAPVSSQTSGGLIERLLFIIVPDFRGMSAQSQFELVEHWQGFIRESAHFAEYFSLGFLFSGLLCSFDKRRVLLNIISVFSPIAVAVCDEIYQSTVPGRSMQLFDVAIDSLGAVCGGLICITIVSSVRGKKRRMSELKERQQLQNQLLKLVSKGLSLSPEQTQNAEYNWRRIFDESVVQAVLALAFSGITAKEKAGMPEMLLAKWRECLCCVFSKYQTIAAAQNSVTGLLENNCVSYVIIKGMASAALYEHPEYRMLGDIDILITPENADKVKLLMESNGYVFSNAGAHHHMNFSKDGVLFEIHLSIAGLPDSEQGKSFLEGVQRQLGTAKKLKVETAEFYALPDEYHAAVTLVHMNHHMISDGLALRHLCDWAVYVSSDNFDEGRLTSLLEPLGILTLAKVYTKVCVEFLSVKSERAVSFCRDVKPEHAQYIIKDIFDKGHFGRKNNSSRGMLVEKQFTLSPTEKKGRGVKGFFAYFSETWQPASEHPSLKFIAPAAVLLRHLRRVLAGKTTLFNPLIFKRKAKKQVEFYREIGLFNSNDDKHRDK